jgi:endonuclease/exonuclease/phosphatase (EEP) superfamily protein YafD
MLQKIAGQNLILDHIFYRDLQLLDTGIAEEAEASDHLPISALFAWQPPVTEDPPPHQE